MRMPCDAEESWADTFDEDDVEEDDDISAEENQPRAQFGDEEMSAESFLDSSHQRAPKAECVVDNPRHFAATDERIGGRRPGGARDGYQCR